MGLGRVSALTVAQQSAHLDVVLANNGECRQEVGESQEVTNLFADIDELEGAACRFGGDVEADERAETHAVHAGEVGQVEDDSFRAGDELADVGVEIVADSGDQFAVAFHYDGVADAFGFQ